MIQTTATTNGGEIRNTSDTIVNILSREYRKTDNDKNTDVNHGELPQLRTPRISNYRISKHRKTIGNAYNKLRRLKYVHAWGRLSNNHRSAINNNSQKHLLIYMGKTKI